MTRIKKIVAVAALLMLGYGAGALWGRGGDTAAPVTAAPAAAGVQVVVVNRHAETPYAVADVAYPSFPALPDLSQWIATFVDERIAEHAQTSEGNYKARVDTATPQDAVSATPAPGDRFVLDITWTPGEISDSLVSVALDGYDYSGGAHGGAWTQTYTYDVAAGKVLTVQDLADRNNTTLAAIAASARTALAEDLLQRSGGTTLDANLRQMLDDGTAPTEENFQTFTVDRGRVTFRFGQYQIAPYAYGTFTYLWVPDTDVSAADVAEDGDAGAAPSGDNDASR